MPRFLDTHTVPIGTPPEEIAEAHVKDLAAQGKHGVRFLKYWYDAATGKVWCLSESPDREAHLAVHREAHGDGGIPDDIFQVEEHE